MNFSYYQNSLRVAKLVAAKHKAVSIEEIGLTRPQFLEWLTTNVHAKGINHKSSPAIFKNGVFVGGNDKFVESVKGMYDGN